MENKKIPKVKRRKIRDSKGKKKIGGTDDDFTDMTDANKHLYLDVFATPEDNGTLIDDRKYTIKI
jgi:hypothetical protein